MFVNIKMYPTCIKPESKFLSNKIKMWNKTGSEAYIKQATFRVMFPKPHPDTHLTRINCHWKLCSLISKLFTNSVRLTRASWWVSIQIPLSKHKKGAPQQQHLTSGDDTRFGSFVSNGRLRISLVCCCNRFEVFALQQCDAASLGNWFPTIRDDERFWKSKKLTRRSSKKR